MIKIWVLPLLLLSGISPLSAGVALLIGEPIGRFAFFSPTGHASIYLSRVCAESPTRLRLCEPGETGVVISRYRGVAGYDWIAMPPLAYFYAVERPEDVPASVDAGAVAQLRDARGIITFYYPHSLRRNLIADFGISTPKHNAKEMAGYGRRRPELSLSRFTIPQLPGKRRSGKIRGVSESLIRSKKYVAPLLLVEPWVAAAAAAAYLTSGRFNPTRQPQTICAPGSLAACMATAERADRQTLHFPRQNVHLR